jgi:hypothetical protein
MKRHARIKPVQIVEISWGGRNYTRESWQRDKKTAIAALPTKGPFFFTITRDNVLIIATAPVSYRVIEEMYEDRFEEDAWVSYRSIADFERNESHLLKSLEV